MHSIVTIETSGAGLYEFTDEATRFVKECSAGDALLTLFVQHTSCSLLIQENADPDVRRDLNEFFHRLAPPSDDESMAWVRHRSEGPDDMPAHIKAAMLPVSLSIPIIDGRLALGIWQGVYLFEHRRAAQRRKVILKITG